MEAPQRPVEETPQVAAASGSDGGSGPPNLERSQRSTDPGEAKVRRGSATYEVEAGGIEPPSEGASTTGSYVCSPRFDVTALAPTGGIARGQPTFVSAPAPPAMTGAQPEK